jgi:hypothetical protein
MPSPGPITRSQSLVQEAFRAINYCRVIAERQPDSDSGDQLRKFFTECAKLCPKSLTPAQIQARAEKALKAKKKAGGEPAAGSATQAASAVE